MSHAISSLPQRGTSWSTLFLLLLGVTACDDGGSQGGKTSHDVPDGGPQREREPDENEDSGPGPGCAYDGEVHEAGALFPATDGCNFCECHRDGSIACTAAYCECTELAPGCGTRPLPKAGCYLQCEGSEDCNPFFQCVRRHVDDGKGGCGVEAHVCLHLEESESP